MSSNYTGIPVTPDTKDDFDSFVRKVEAEHDRDYTQNEVVGMMLAAVEPGELEA